MSVYRYGCFTYLVSVGLFHEGLDESQNAVDEQNDTGENEDPNQGFALSEEQANTGSDADDRLDEGDDLSEEALGQLFTGDLSDDVQNTEDEKERGQNVESDLNERPAENHEQDGENNLDHTADNLLADKVQNGGDQKGNTQNGDADGNDVGFLDDQQNAKQNGENGGNQFVDTHDTNSFDNMNFDERNFTTEL